MPILIDLGFAVDIDLDRFKNFSNNDIEFLIYSNINVDTCNLRKKLENFKVHIFQSALYIREDKELQKFKEYFLKKKNLKNIVSYEEFICCNSKDIACDTPISIKQNINLAIFYNLKNKNKEYFRKFIEKFSKYYTITIILKDINNEKLNFFKSCAVENIEYFMKHIDSFDRVIYYLDRFNSQIYNFAKQNEGIVVFDKFYKSIFSNEYSAKDIPAFYSELYYSFGYSAIFFFKKNNIEETLKRYCIEKNLINSSLGVINSQRDVIIDTFEKKDYCNFDDSHDISTVARLSFDFIERIYLQKPILKDMIDYSRSSNIDKRFIAKAISSIKKSNSDQKTIFVDITELYSKDTKTGIQRVVRAQLMELLKFVGDTCFRIEPVYYDVDSLSYRYARDFMKKILNIDEWNLENEIIDIEIGDIFYGLDYAVCKTLLASNNEIYNYMRAKGCRIFFVVYDNIPIAYPYFFEPQVSIDHDRWLKTITKFADGLVCISEFVTKDVERYIEINCLRKPPIIKSIKLGYDIKSSIPTKGLDKNLISILKNNSHKLTFLMVGTLEPRKGHDAAIKAFTLLWNNGYDVNLVIVGKAGWMADELLYTISNHKEIGNRLIYIQFASDEMLDKIYELSSCLVAANRAEGFGLPIVEAAIHGLPIIARNLDVFREVSSNSATFFDIDEELPMTIVKWLNDFKMDKHIKSDKVKLVSWRESAMQAYEILTGDF